MAHELQVLSRLSMAATGAVAVAADHPDGRQDEVSQTWL